MLAFLGVQVMIGSSILVAGAWVARRNGSRQWRWMARALHTTINVSQMYFIVKRFKTETELYTVH
jgi:hypothetical protein